MRSYSRRALLTGIGGATATALFGSPATATDPVEVESVYVWSQSADLVANPGTAIASVSRVGVERVYLAWGPLRSTDPEQIATFIQRCHEADIEVYALTGLSGWGATRSAEQVVTEIDDYNQDNTAFDGIQLDVEPGGEVAPHYEFWLSVLYVGLLDSLDERGLPDVTVAVAPWWFDRAEAAATRVRDHDTVESVVVMAYADEYTSTQGISVRGKLNTALEGCSKPYAAALEFQDPDAVVSLPEDATLHGERERAAEIIERLEQNPPENGTGEFRGVAFHHYPYLDVLY